MRGFGLFWATTTYYYYYYYYYCFLFPPSLACMWDLVMSQMGRKVCVATLPSIAVSLSQLPYPRRLQAHGFGSNVR